MQTNLNVMVNGNNLGLQAMAYKYDQLNRIKETQAWAYEKNAQTNVMAWTAQGKRYKEGFSYDGNGNIVSLLRYAQAGGTNPIDNLEYGYNYHNNDPTKLINNQLKSIKDLSNSDEGLKSKGQVEQGFSYDAIGNLLSDAEGEVIDIKWTVYGKIEEVKKTDNKTIKYRYDGTGNRSAKMLYAGTTLTKTTYYFRDASGNVMGIYEQTEQTLSTGEGGVRLIEQPIYGSSRIGTYNGKSTQFKITLGNKQYELSNHLSNTLITLSDNKIGVDAGTDNTADYYEARVLSATDYYAFGMAMKERSWQSESYRYGFNGKEKDKDFGEETTDFGARLMNSKIGRWMAVDPLSGKYPSMSPYCFVANSPLNAIDPDGQKILIIGDRLYVMAVMAMLDIIRQSSDLGNQVITTLMNSDNIHAINVYNTATLFQKVPIYFNELSNNGIISSTLAKEAVSKGTEIAFVISHSAFIYSATNYNDLGDIRDGSGSEMFFNLTGLNDPNNRSIAINHKFLHELWHMYQNETGAMGTHANHNHGISSSSDPDELAANDGADRINGEMTNFMQINNYPILSIGASNQSGSSYKNFLVGSIFSNNPTDIVLNRGNPISFSVVYDNTKSSNGYYTTPSTTITTQYHIFAGKVGLLRRLPPTISQKLQISNIHNWIRLRGVTVLPSNTTVEYKPIN